jgi:3-oxoacyl-[acyl-carrier-protein] synthase III
LRTSEPGPAAILPAGTQNRARLLAGGAALRNRLLIGRNKLVSVVKEQGRTLCLGLSVLFGDQAAVAYLTAKQKAPEEATSSFFRCHSLG